jgi:two-component system cell cycle sensor histidine kinase/response regulator CckA
MKDQRAIRQMVFAGAELASASSANPQPGPDGEGLYRSLLDSLQTVVFTTDAEGRFTLLNQAWTDLTGFSRDESIGRALSTELTSAEPSRTARLFAELLAGEREEVRQEFRVLTRTGQALWLDMHARVVRAPDGTPRGCAGTFVTSPSVDG